MYNDLRRSGQCGEMSEKRYLPEGLVGGCKLKCDVKKDAVITYDDVALPPNRWPTAPSEQYPSFSAARLGWRELLAGGLEAALVALGGAGASGLRPNCRECPA